MRNDKELKEILFDLFDGGYEYQDIRNILYNYDLTDEEHDYITNIKYDEWEKEYTNKKTKETNKQFMLLELHKYIKDNYKIFDDLCKRLQDDYNCIEEFNQHEEDRLIIYNILEYVDEIKKFERESE